MSLPLFTPPPRPSLPLCPSPPTPPPRASLHTHIHTRRYQDLSLVTFIPRADKVRLSFTPGTDSGQTLLEEQEREISKASSSSASAAPPPSSQLLNNNATVQLTFNKKDFESLSQMIRAQCDLHDVEVATRGSGNSSNSAEGTAKGNANGNAGRGGAHNLMPPTPPPPQMGAGGTTTAVPVPRLADKNHVLALYKKLAKVRERVTTRASQRSSKAIGNVSLRALAEHLPQTLEQFACILDMQRAEEYGQAFIDRIKKYVELGFSFAGTTIPLAPCIPPIPMLGIPPPIAPPSPAMPAIAPAPIMPAPPAIAPVPPVCAVRLPCCVVVE